MDLRGEKTPEVKVVTLEYDRGTVIVRGLDYEISPLRWDPRAKCLRALAYKYIEIKRSLELLGFKIEDKVFSPIRGSIGTPNLK
ncbi:MAG: hypothetical protein ACXQTI_00630, partial [Candidatus Nezhaarchaeales archaeon]